MFWHFFGKQVLKSFSDGKAGVDLIYWSLNDVNRVNATSRLIGSANQFTRKGPWEI